MEASLAEWNYVHLLGKKLDYLHLKDLLKYEIELYSKQPLAPSQYKIIVVDSTSSLSFTWTMKSMLTFIS